MRTHGLLAGLLVLAVVAAGCGSELRDREAAGTDGTLTRADSLCRDLAVRRDAIRQLAAGTQREAPIARAYGALADLTVDAADELGAIEQPGAHAEAFRRYVAAVQRDAGAAWQVRHALAANDLPRAKTLVEEASVSAAVTRKLAREAGLRICGARA
jgi:hypothetical protein